MNINIEAFSDHITKRGSHMFKKNQDKTGAQSDTDLFDDEIGGGPSDSSAPSGEKLDVYKTVSFSHKELPKGGLIFVDVEGTEVAVFLPTNVKDGQTICEFGKGIRSKTTGRRGDLYVTVRIKSQPSGVKPVLICGMIVAAIVLLALCFAGFSGSDLSDEDYPPITDPAPAVDAHELPSTAAIPDPTDPAGFAPLSPTAEHYRVSGQIGAGGRQTTVIRSDGTAVARGDNSFGACDVDGWSDLIMVSSGDFFTVGLRSDGTVVSTGDNDDGQRNLSGWENIVFLTAGDFHTIGITADGQVLVQGRNTDGQCNVSELPADPSRGPALAAAGGYRHTVVLYSDGTVAAIGGNNHGQCNVDSWRDVIAVYAGANFTVGLTSNGTVLATGDNQYDQCNVDSWTNVRLLAAGDFHTVAVTHDGKIYATGMGESGQLNMAGWDDISAIGAGCRHTVAVRYDGTFLATGENKFGQCDLYGITY